MQMLVFFADSAAGSALLKATTTKTIFVPAYTRHDGAVVPGHSKIVHYDPAKSTDSVLAGSGSHSQKAALKKLEKLNHWDTLSENDKHLHVLSSATNIQNKASTAAAISGWKKAAMAGKIPTLSQQKAFGTLPISEQQKHISNMTTATPIPKNMESAEEAQIGAGAVPETVAEKTAAGNKFSVSMMVLGEKLRYTKLIDSWAAPDGSMVYEASYKFAALEYLSGEPVDSAYIVKYTKSARADGVDILMESGVPALDAINYFFPLVAIDHFESSHLVFGLGEDSYHVVDGKWVKGQAIRAASDTDPHPTETPQSNPWTDDQWSHLYLSDTNSNSPSHNKKIDAMKNAGDAGDVAAIQGMKFGSNTYGKKQAIIAEHLIAAMAPAKPAYFSDLSGWAMEAEKGHNPTPEQWAAFDTLGPDQKLSKMKLVQSFYGSIAHLKPKGQEVFSDAPAGVWNFEKNDPDFDEMPSIWMNKNGMSLHIVYWGEVDGFEVAHLDHDSDDLGDSLGFIDAGMAHLAAFDLAVKNGIEPPPVSDFMQLSGEGPKEGDVKELNGVSYVLKDGRWHRVGEDQEEDGAAPAESFDVPAEKSYANQYQLHFNDGKSNKFYNIHVDGNSLIASWGKVGTKGQTQVKEFHSAKLAKKELNKKLNEKLGKGYLTAEIAKVETHSTVDAVQSIPAKSSSGDDLIDVAPHSPHSSSDEYKYVDVSGWAKIGDQKGSNDGGVFKDKLGGKWYVKFPGSADIAKSEFMATKLYQMFGLPVPNSKLVIKNGKVGIASKWNETVSKASAEKLAKAAHAHSGFVIDAWLANWDVVGLELDNLLLNDKGEAVRLDNGGALAYRAQGVKKGAAFGRDVPELDTLLDPSKNATSAAVFKGIKKSDLKAGAELLAKIKPSQIDEICEKIAIGTLMDQMDLAEKLNARRTYVINKFGIEDPWNKPKPDETKLFVAASDVPAVLDFENWNGTGKGLSSKGWLNKQNTADSAALIEFAKNGNLVALKNYQYDIVNKESGAVIGKASMAEHPSAHIKEQWVGLIDLLTSIAYPPAESLTMPALSGAADPDDLASAAGFFDPTETVETVSSEHRLGFFLKVDMIEGIQELVESTTWGWIAVSGKWAQSMKAAYNSFSSVIKSYISSVQGNGSINHVWSQGKSSVSLSGFDVGVQELAAKVYNNAVELPENVQLWRWMNDTTAGKSMTKQLIDAKPGLVLQNTNSMCASFGESWGNEPHFGHQVLMRIRCPKGAKGTPSFASGSHNSEKEITTLPGARFVVVSTKKGVPGNPNGVMVDCVMLPPHDGYVSSLKQLAALGKSILLFFRRLFA